MMKIAVVTDSNSGISQAKAEELGIFVLPMPFTIDDQEYLEDINLTQEAFYEKLATGAEVFTSQPAVADVADLWDRILKEYDQIVHIPMTSGLSSSYQTARMLAQEEEYEEKVFVVDARTISVTQAYCVMDAKKMADRGYSAEEIQSILEHHKETAPIYITVDTLKYLKKGGRITPVAAALGTLLRIKPILTIIEGGKLDAFAKVRTMKQAKETMISAAKTQLEGLLQDPESSRTRIAVAHTCNEEMAQAFVKELEELYPKAGTIYCSPLSLSVACHIGPGSLAVALYQIPEALWEN